MCRNPEGNTIGRCSDYLYHKSASERHARTHYSAQESAGELSRPAGLKLPAYLFKSAPPIFNPGRDQLTFR